ncbi:hypothetical protein HaLaN_09584 [Haematococcus lacustris]|uniref:Uncharacterized protein n=1 Tax=Haematococcus lacustris TaxID=44745 RepID=A0A699YWR5_HAELA|nr:hypothetical protein HaLaN_09584 [Haematococcus lacustris]
MVVQLRMVHAGHVGQLNDFAWSTAAGMAPMLASVSGTCAESGQAPQLQGCWFCKGPSYKELQWPGVQGAAAAVDEAKVV